MWYTIPRKTVRAAAGLMVVMSGAAATGASASQLQPTTMIPAPVVNGGSQNDQLQQAQAWVGMGVIDLNPLVAQQLGMTVTQGVVIFQVAPNSPAERSGLMAHDIITLVNGATPVSAAAVLQTIAALQPGEALTITVERQGLDGQLSVTVTADQPTQVQQGIPDATWLPQTVTPDQNLWPQPNTVYPGWPQANTVYPGVLGAYGLQQYGNTFGNNGAWLPQQRQLLNEQAWRRAHDRWHIGESRTQHQDSDDKQSQPQRQDSDDQQTPTQPQHTDADQRHVDSDQHPHQLSTEQAHRHTGS